jgi:hypothetical protein
LLLTLFIRFTVLKIQAGFPDSDCFSCVSFYLGKDGIYIFITAFPADIRA